jgi:hypothetical protein
MLLQARCEHLSLVILARNRREFEGVMLLDVLSQAPNRGASPSVN